MRGTRAVPSGASSSSPRRPDRVVTGSWQQQPSQVAGQRADTAGRGISSCHSTIRMGHLCRPPNAQWERAAPRAPDGPWVARGCPQQGSLGTPEAVPRGPWAGGGATRRGSSPSPSQGSAPSKDCACQQGASLSPRPRRKSLAPRLRGPGQKAGRPAGVGPRPLVQLGVLASPAGGYSWKGPRARAALGFQAVPPPGSLRWHWSS